jgi:hypothetical protein
LSMLREKSIQTSVWHGCPTVMVEATLWSYRGLSLSYGENEDTRRLFPVCGHDTGGGEIRSSVVGC